MNILSILLKLLKSSTVSTTKSFPEIIESFKDHQRKIEEIFYLRWEEFQFKFHSVSESEVRKVLLKMDEKKADLTGDILAGIRKLRWFLHFCTDWNSLCFFKKKLLQKPT